MKRPAAAERTLERIQAWRAIRPELVIRSTFIVGFPGETEEEFQELLDFLEKAQLDRVGCFKYSDVEGAKANELPDPVSEEVKQQRFERFMAVQSQISANKLQQKIGLEYQILIDEVTSEGAIGRCFADAPEIDGNVYLTDEFDVQPGDLIWGQIIHADEHDMWAVKVED
jgi:ribosomal protein S12 methylthiotransferase